VLFAIFPTGITMVFVGLRPGWSSRRVMLISAGAMPVILLGLCGLLFAHATLSSPARCGVDACGMAMAAAYYGGLAALVGWAIGALFSAITLAVIRRS
jgi:hypothetical protein